MAWLGQWDFEGEIGTVPPKSGHLTCLLQRTWIGSQARPLLYETHLLGHYLQIPRNHRMVTFCQLKRTEQISLALWPTSVYRFDLKCFERFTEYDFELVFATLRGRLSCGKGHLTPELGAVGFVDPRPILINIWLDIHISSCLIRPLYTRLSRQICSTVMRVVISATFAPKSEKEKNEKEPN